VDRQEEIPEALRQHFSTAMKLGAAYILFYQ
jgi:hypothetical protein